MSSGTYIVLVTVHNIVRVPKEVASLTTPGIRFRVAANAIGTDGAATAQLSKTCPEVSATFEPRDLQQIQQNHFEVKLDGTSGSGRGSLEWTSSTPSIDVLISVKEEVGSDGGKTIAAANTFTLDLLDIIERRKLRTLIVGTSMGYVGVSFAVAPSDTAGYRKRLEAFLKEHNPRGLQLVANVVASVSELDTFTKVGKKYNLVDYKKRVQRFFATYGADHMSQCDVILKQWENREEELMRNLILDNGPELCDVDLKLRLTAFAKKYKLSGGEFDIGQLVRQHAPNPQPFFDELIEKYGPEPDPRLYLFGPTFYGEKASESPRRPSARRNTNASSSTPTASSNAPPALQSSVSSSFGPLVDEVDTAAPATGGGKRSGSSYNLPPADGDTAAAMRAAASGTYASSAALRNTVAFHEPDAPAASAGGAPRGLPSSHAMFRPREATPPPANAATSSGNVAAAPLNAVELWSTLIEDLRSASIPSAELHYLNEASFLSLLGELGYGATAKQLLVAEWQRRVQATLRMEQLTHGDSLFEAAKRDVITISGLHPLNVTVVGVTLLKNSEHESSFSLRLGEAKMRTTERLVVVGEHHRLMGYAANGVSQQPQLESTLPACVFHRKPFHNLHRPTSVAVLVCDVVIGKPFIGASSSSDAGAAASQLTAPKEGSPTFLREFDSCVFLDPVAGQSVAVYQPQQVLPKYLVQCNVDTTVTPCPAHPSKAVEFFVVESNVFACSQCVVMGQYRGKEVLTVEDATLQARSQLQDIQRDILHVVSEMAAAEADCDRQVQTLQQSEVRMSANRQIELIRREAEQRIAAIQQDLESYERQRKDAVLDARAQAKRVMDDAQGVAKQLDDGLRYRGPNEVISLLINTRRTGMVDSIKDRANAVRHGGTGDGGIAMPGTLSGTGSTQPQQASLPTFRSSSNPPFAHQRSGSAVGSTGATATAAFNANTPASGQQPPSTNVSFAAAGDESFSGLNRTPRAGAPSSNNTAAPGAPPLDTNALYNKFLSLKHQTSSGITGMGTPSATSVPRSGPQASSWGHATQQAQDRSATFGQPPSATRAAARVTADLEAKRMKDLITSGWAEFRKGDKHAAQRIWQDVYERNQQNATGARAKAYIAEAIEKNYAAAGQWYEKALAYDPQDCLTLYNYGVLLESVMDRKRDALQLFETAHRLGDQTAGKRAAQLKLSLQAS